MHLVIENGIVDNDANGTTGVGTIFYRKIFVDTQQVEYFTWGLLEQLNGSFCADAKTRPYTVQRDVILAEARDAEKRKVADEKLKRENSVSHSDEIIAILNKVISDNQDVVAQVKTGKEKAFNSLVGKVISKVKQAGFSPVDAYSISVMLKRVLA
jgi:GatB domain